MIIFCSHSSKDIELVRPLQERVEAMGWELYLFEDDKQPGEYVASKLQQAIERADVVLVILTHNSKQSNYVHQEIGYASARKKPIIPLVEQGVSKRVLGMLDGREYLSFRRGANSEEMLASVFESLEEFIKSIEGQSDVNDVMRDVLIAFLVIAVLAIGIAYLTRSGPFSSPGPA